MLRVILWSDVLTANGKINFEITLLNAINANWVAKLVTRNNPLS